jgi:uncharacterized protein YqhQ
MLFAFAHVTPVPNTVRKLGRHLRCGCEFVYLGLIIGIASYGVQISAYGAPLYQQTCLPAVS